MEGLISGGVMSGIKKTFRNIATAVLIEIHF